MSDPSQQPPKAPLPAPGWFIDPHAPGTERWWSGVEWTEHRRQVSQQAVQQPLPPQHTMGPMTSGSLNVKREVIYNREQKGHSLTKHILLGWVAFYIPTIYYAVSPNHYFHA